jgi:glucosyl-dolichyl phosphate glucuronosyltransferase
MPAPTVSVVICAYTQDRWDQICAAVDSVHAQSLPGAEVLLVVDHNPALHRRAADALPDVLVLENEQARGLSGARNTGASRAKGDIVAFLDDDAAADEDWLKFLVDSYENPQVIGVGGLTVPRWQKARPAWLPEEFYWVMGCNYKGMPPAGTPVRNLIGANMSFRREAFELVPEGFPIGIGRESSGRPLGCEETEFCIKLGRRAPESVLVMDHRAVVSHFVSDTRCGFSYFRSRCFAEGISKARITASVGNDGVSAERSYATRALPLGVLRGITAPFRGDAAGVARAGAIVAGFSVTAAGYLSVKVGRAS